MHRWITADTLLHVGETELRFSRFKEAHLARVGALASRAHNASHQINFETSRCGKKRCIVASDLWSPAKSRNAISAKACSWYQAGRQVVAFKKRQRWAGLVFEICKWRLEAPPRLNHQISIPSKGSSARWFGGSFLLHFRGHSVVNLCAYRNLYSWEIPSTKRLDCLGGLIGTPFGDDDQRFVYIKMLQFLLLGLGSWICFDNKR